MLPILVITCVLWVYFRYLGPILIAFRRDFSFCKRPTRVYHKAACWDLYANTSVVIPVNQWREIPTGISIAPLFHFYISFLNATLAPFGNVAFKIHTRSGLAHKKGLRNHLGIIDGDYRKELSIITYNHGKYPVAIKGGDKVAQIEVYRVPSVWIFEKTKLSKSKRGENGFGSSGNN